MFEVLGAVMKTERKNKVKGFHIRPNNSVTNYCEGSLFRVEISRYICVADQLQRILLL